MRSGSERRLLVAVLLGALPGLAGACTSRPVYQPAQGQPLTFTPDKVIELPAPPSLPPPPAPQDIREILSKDDGGAERLRPGDVLSVTVRDEPELSVAKARVTREGNVRLPWLGELRVGGRTRQELQDDLERRLAKTFVKRADVTVELLGDECRKVYVLGRVQKPGVIALPIDRRLTLVQVVALAGGLSTNRLDLEADPSSIRLIRKLNGERRTFRLSFEQILDRDQLERDVYVEPDDIVYVPPKKELYIFGSVARPGNFPLADGSRLSIAEALALAGGFGGSADRDRVTVIRHGADGGAETYQVNMADEKQRTTTQVTANDTVIVSDRSARRVFVLGNVEKPGSYELDEKNLTLIRILAIAGGFKRIADTDSVELHRTTTDGQKTYRVPVSSILNNDHLENDPVLVPGDIIVVKESFF